MTNQIMIQFYMASFWKENQLVQTEGKKKKKKLKEELMVWRTKV
jgi:hypothetical protein